MRHPTPWLLVVLLAAATPARASCGGAFCSLNTQWASQGLWTESGARLDLRYEYIDQDRPRAGRNKVAVGEIPRDHDEGERVTSQLSGLGDVRVLGRWRAGADDRDTSAWGLIGGLKLPTGDFKETDAGGTPAERTLQPGTGTTDAIVGVYYHGQKLAGGKPVRVFAHVQVQAALDVRDDYKPGDQLGLDAGLAFPVTHNWSAMLQANALIRKRDGGVQADPQDSGGTWLWLSPGAAYRLGPQSQVYAFVQLPLYQRVNGVQLTADQTVAVGINYRF